MLHESDQRPADDAAECGPRSNLRFDSDQTIRSPFAPLCQGSHVGLYPFNAGFMLPAPPLPSVVILHRSAPTYHPQSE
jgi:hypothetical protein